MQFSSTLGETLLERKQRRQAGSAIVGVRFPRVVGKVWSRSRRIGGPAVLSVTAAVLTFLLRPVTTHSRGYIRDVKTRTHARTHSRIRIYVLAGRHTSRNGTYIWTRAGRDIWEGEGGRVLSYPFYHNNSPAMYKYTRIYVCTKVVGYVGWKGTGFNLVLSIQYISRPPSSPSSSRIALFLFLLSARPPPRFSLPLSRLAGLQSNRLHLWPVELNLLTVALFLMAHFHSVKLFVI